MLRPGRRAALRWADLLRESDLLDLYQPPELDIVTYLPRVPADPAAGAPLLSAVDAASADVMHRGMGERSVFLATYAVPASALRARGHAVTADVDRGRILRSVLMKPEAEPALDGLHHEVSRLAAAALTTAGG